MRKLAKIFSVLLAIVMTVTFAACSADEPEAEAELSEDAAQETVEATPSPVSEPPPSGTLSLGVTGKLSAHPHSGDNALTTGILEGLLRTENYDYLPGVAKDCETDDYTAWRFTLRDTAKWSDGVSVTADDFLLGWKLAKESGALDSYAELKGMTMSAESADVVLIQLQAPCAWLPQYAASAILAPVHSALYEKDPSVYGKTPETTGCNGAYALTALSDESAELTKNEHYWDKASVSVENVRLRVYADEAALSSALKEGMIHLAKWEGVDASVKQIALQSATTLTILMNRMRMMENDEMVNEEISGILSSAQFRMALSYAIDRTKLAESAADAYQAANYQVPWVVNANYPSPISDGKTVRNYESARTIQSKFTTMNQTANADVAKDYLNRFLSEMNYSGVEKLPAFTLTAADDETSKSVAQSVCTQISQILNIKISPDLVSRQELTKRAEAGDYDLILYPVKAAYNDPSSILNLFGKDDVYRGAWAFMDPQAANFYEQSLETARAATSSEDRLAHLLQAESIALLAAPILPLYYQNEFVATDGSFAGITLTWDGRVDYAYAHRTK